jgi:hypothetical protein
MIKLPIAPKRANILENLGLAFVLALFVTFLVNPQLVLGTFSSVVFWLMGVN